MVRNSIQDGARFQAVDRAEKACKINPSEDLTVLRGDPGNSVRLPDVGENLSFDDLQFIQLFYRMSPVADCKTSLFGQRAGIENADFRRSIAHKDLAAIAGQTPSFSGISKLAQQLEVAQSIHKSCLRLPCQLHHCILQQGNSFTKELWCEVDAPNHLPSFQSHLAKRGTTLQAGAFV